jgi:hypothetical protein
MIKRIAYNAAILTEGLHPGVAESRGLFRIQSVYGSFCYVSLEDVYKKGAVYMTKEEAIMLGQSIIDAANRIGVSKFVESEAGR